MNSFYWIACFGIVFLGSTLFLVPAFSKNRTNVFSYRDFISKIIGSFLISIGILEIILTVFATSSEKVFPPAPQVFMTHKVHSHILIRNSILFTAPPNGEYRNFGHRFWINSLGFREREFSKKKPKGVFRILVFGGSFTFGNAIDNDHRYTNLVEDMLRVEIGNSFEVLNFGMAAYKLDQKHDLMKAVLKTVETDLVVVGFHETNLGMTTKKDLLQYAKTGVSGKIIKELSIKEKFFFNHVRNLKTVPYNEPNSFRSYRPWYKKGSIYHFLEKRTNLNKNEKLPNVARWNYSLNEYKGMLRLTEKNQLPPPIVVLLHSGSIDPNKNNFNNPIGERGKITQLYQFVGKQLKKMGFHIVDTLPLFKKYSGMSMAVSEWERHPNYLGHYIFAKAVFDYLISNNLVTLPNP